MLKHCINHLLLTGGFQPPSGGCVLKPIGGIYNRVFIRQPPSGGCVLKQPCPKIKAWLHNQPPSGGCVLKQINRIHRRQIIRPAAFRRLCVETKYDELPLLIEKPAAFRRLCVETLIVSVRFLRLRNQPPSGGCVLKPRIDCRSF